VVLGLLEGEGGVQGVPRLGPKGCRGARGKEVLGTLAPAMKREKKREKENEGEMSS
jgi:hypothetical protein